MGDLVFQVRYKTLLALKLRAHGLVFFEQALISDLDLVEHALDSLKVPTVAFELFLASLESLVLFELLNLLEELLCDVLNFCGLCTAN